MDDDLQRSAGLQSTAYAVLVHLSEAPDRRLRMSQLAERTALSPSRMTRVIDRLELQGLVHRVPCAEDGRATLAELTEAGVTRLRAAWPAHLALVHELVLDELEHAELEALASIAERLVARAQASGRLGAAHLTQKRVSA